MWLLGGKRVSVGKFQVRSEDAKPLLDVVEISVENEIITNLPEPVKISFDHEYIPVSLFGCFECFVDVKPSL